jgi:hypothetical protein
VSLMRLNYIDIPSDVREYAEIIADLSLYRNCTELLMQRLSPSFHHIFRRRRFLRNVVLIFWHTEYLRGHEDIKEDLNSFFDLVTEEDNYISRQGI